MHEYAHQFDLTGRRAMVVGAGSGIGQASAHALAAQGAEVVCADRDGDAAGATADAIQGEGGAASALRLDITDPAQVAAAVAEVGAPEVLVVTPSINVRKPVLDLTDQDVERVLDLNLRGVFRVVREFARPMAQNGRGSIVLFSSIRSQVVEPGQGIYAATKAGTVMLAKALASELGGSGVRVNVVQPGVVETPLTRQIRDRPDWYRAYAEKGALGRWARPSEIAGAVCFLASDAANYVTGTELAVDGGWLAQDGRYTPPL